MNINIVEMNLEMINVFFFFELMNLWVNLKLVSFFCEI